MHVRFAVPTRRISRFAVLFLVTIILAPAPSRAQEGSDVTVKLGGLVQAEASYGWLSEGEANESRDRIGLGLRRVRLRANAAIGPRAGAFIHVDGDGGTFGVLDAFAHYDATPNVRLRIGRMASAQPRAFILTPVMAMDTNERAAIALLWNGRTLGNKGRDFGIDLTYRTDLATAIFFVHNGDGSFDRLRGNFQENLVGDATGGTDKGLSDMAFSFYTAVTPPRVPGLEVGGYVGYNGSRNPSTAVSGSGRKYVSYSAHAYWGALPGSQSIRIKADAIGVQYDELSTVPSQHSLGLSLLGAVAVHRAAEVFGRIESYDANLDAEGMSDLYVTAGMSYSLSRLRGRPFPQERLTLAYGVRIPDDDDAPTNNLLVLQLQVNF